MSPFIQTWSLFDKLYYHCSRLQFVDKQEKNIFRVRLLTYRGQNFTLSNGTHIQSHDILLKIHLHNCLLMREMQDIKNDLKRALYVYQRVQRSLPGLAEFVQNHSKKEDIKAVLGITVLTRGVKPLGFDVIDIHNPIYKRIKELHLIPMFILCHPEGKMNLFKKSNLDLKYLVMSKDQLLKRYL